MSDQLEIDVNKGKRAEQKMSDPFFQEVLEKIKKDQVNKMISSSPERPEVRDTAYYMLKAVEALELELNKLISNGQFAENQIKRGRK